MAGLRKQVDKHDQQTGNLNGSITLVEYGDYQCPHCGIAHPFIKKLLREFEGTLHFVFRNFPLEELHPFAMPAAQAAEAAGQQNRFWEMHDRIYEFQTRLSPEFLLKSADALHLKVDQFNTDREGKSILSKIEDDFDSGIRSGVNGTPSFFINGIKLNTYDETYESLQEAIKNS